MVPPTIKAKRTLVVASDATYPPMEYFSAANTLTGFDIDLTTDIATELGLRAKHVNASFDTILPGLASGRYDLGASTFTITAARRDVVDFVPYLKTGSALGVKTGNPLGLSLRKPLSLCGRDVGAESGTIQAVTLLPAISAQCKAAGRPVVGIKVFPTSSAANVALTSGRTEAVMAGYVAVTLEAKASHGAFEVAPGGIYNPEQNGLALPKGSKLGPAINAALRNLTANGTFSALMVKYSLPTTITLLGTN